MARMQRKGLKVPRRSIALICLAALDAVAAVFFMQPCTPVAAVVGVLVGCVLGLLLALVAAPFRSAPVPHRRGVRAILWTVAGALVVVTIPYIGPGWPVPAWARSIGYFAMTGAWLTFIAAPFTVGVSMLFFERGGKVRTQQTP